MKWLWLIGSALGVVGLLVVRRRWRFTNDLRPVSRAWLRHLWQLGNRVEFHGPAITKPIDKLMNERGWYQAEKLRRK